MIDTGYIQALMEREVSRKEFLRYVGIALLSVAGGADLVKNLKRSQQLTSTSQARSDNKLIDYGENAYGG